MVIIYVKGFLMLLKNISQLLTDTIGLLINIMIPVDCDGVSSFMNLVYYNYRKKRLAYLS